MTKLFLVLLVMSVPVFSQTKVVTNFDLEKFRIEREASEQSLRESYRRQGLPTPEEVARERAERRRELESYVEQRRAADASVAARQAELNRVVQVPVPVYSNGNDYRGGQVIFTAQPAFWGFNPFWGGGGWRGGNRLSPALRRISQLPPNMRTVLEGALPYPGTVNLIPPPAPRVRPCRGC